MSSHHSDEQQQEQEEKKPLLSSSNNDDDYEEADDDGVYGSINAKNEESSPRESTSTPSAPAAATSNQQVVVAGEMNQLKTEDQKKEEGDDDDEKKEGEEEASKYQLTPEERAVKRSFWFTVTVVTYIVLAASWLTLFLTKAVTFDFTAQVLAYPLNATSSNSSSQVAEYLTAYNVKYTVADLFIVDCVRALPMIVFFLIMRGRPASLHPYAYHYTTLFWFVVTAKAWTFEGWSQLPCIAMVMSLVTCTLSLYAHDQIYDCDVPPNVILKFSGVKKVMGPYLAPTGKWNKIVVFSLWGLVAASKASTLVSPILLGNAVKHISHRDTHAAAVQLIIYGVLQLVPQILESIQDTVSSYVFQVSYREVAENAFTTVLGLDLHWHLTKKLGKVMRSIDRGMNAAERLMSWVLMWVVPNIGTGVMSFIVFVAHFRQPELAAVCWLSLCLYIWVTVLITKIRRRYNEKENVHDNEAHDNSTDAMINIEVVKSFTNEEMETKNYVESVKKMQFFNYKGQMFTAAVNTSQGTVIQVCTVATLILAGIHAVHSTPIDGVVEVGTFVAISQYLTNLFSPLSFIGSLYSMTITALVDVQNLAEIMDETPELKDRPDAVEFRSRFPKISTAPTSPSKQPVGDGVAPVIAETDGITVEFEDVHFHYPTQDPDKGIKGVSFKMEPGTMTAIVGPTGAGKSSIGSKLMFGFFEPQKGVIKFNGCDRKEFTAISLRKEIGVIPQDTVLFNNTLRYNVRYGKMDATEEEIQEAVRVAQLPATLERLNNGLETVVGERGARLSGGERQRVAIARAILKNAPIQIFDEATSALDNETERQLQESLDVLARGRRTSLVIAHRLTTIQNADQIIVMDKGCIIERGKHEELLEMKGQYYRMWTAQKKAAEEKEKEEKQKKEEEEKEEMKRQASLKSVGASGDGTEGENKNKKKDE